MKTVVPIMDSSEQPDTEKGKKMTAQQVKDMKMFLGIILTLLLTIGAWTAFSAILSSNGSMPHLAHATTVLWILSAVNFAFAPVIFFGMKQVGR